MSSSDCSHLAPSRSLVAALRLGGLVEPVRRHAGFGHHVHGLGAQLELDVHARGARPAWCAATGSR